MQRLIPILLAFGLALAGCCPCVAPRGVRATPRAVVADVQTVALVPNPTRRPSFTPTPELTAARPTPGATARPAPSKAPSPTPLPPTPAASPTPFGLVSIPRATVVYYDVAGDTAADLRAQLDALGPLNVSGERWDAICSWNYWWSWPGKADGTCDLARATVTYRVQVHFPRWEPPIAAEPDLMVLWAAYAGALVEHELGHVDRAILGVTAIEEALKAAECDTANESAQAVVARIQAENDAYDEATEHGLAQGARFP